MLELPVKLTAVKEAKKMLKKSDLCTGLLDNRNTPPQGMTYSLAQRFLCRRTKSNLPISESLLSQSVPPVNVVRDKHLGRRAKAKAHYDKTASRDLPPLTPGQYVYARPNEYHRGEQWGHSEVLGEVTPRSYVIKTQDGLVRLNRIHLRPNERQVPCDPQPLPQQPVIDSGVDVGNSAETMVPNPNSESMNENSPPPVQTSRYGRPIRPSKRLDL